VNYLFFCRAQTTATKNLTERKFMKLKLIVALSVIAVAFVIVGTGCGKSSKESMSASGQTVAYYTCPMHPSVKSDNPDACPVCGMALQPVYTNAPAVKP
jgi:hypothetical protein